MPEKVRELLEELRSVTGKVGLLDTILPPVIFLLLNGLAGFTAAMIGALGLSLLTAILRLRRGQSLLYALAGMGSVGLAIVHAGVQKEAEEMLQRIKSYLPNSDIPIVQITPVLGAHLGVGALGFAVISKENS